MDDEICDARDICNAWYDDLQKAKAEIANLKNGIVAKNYVIAKHLDTISELRRVIKLHDMDEMVGFDERL